MNWGNTEKKEGVYVWTTSWMVRLSLALILTLVPILAVPPSTMGAAVDPPDQTSGAGDPEGSYRANGLAQSFTAGKSGYLNQIDLYMVDYGSPEIVFTLSIYGGQSVSGTVLASAVFDSSNIPYAPGGWLNVLFDQPAQVQAGQQYTMHLTSSIGETPQTTWKLYTTNVYAGGNAYTASNWSNYDMGFTTYVGDSPRDYTTTLAVSPINGTYGQAVTISATLTTPEGPLAGKRVTVYIDGSSIGYLTTNSAGYSSGSYSLRQAAGSYELKVSIAASYPYPAAEQTTTLTVNKASLTVTPNNATRPYGTSNGNFTMGFSGLMAWDTAASLGQPMYSTSADASSPIGNYELTASGLTSTKYTISYSPGTLTVTQAPLTVTAADQSRAYGQSNPTLTGSITGLVNGDAIQMSYSTAAAVSSPVGLYPIVPALSDPGGKLNNYHVVIEEGELTVTKAELRVATNSASRWVGKANPQLNGNLTGAVAGDSITAQYESAAVEDSAEGVYDITAQLLDPLNRLSNYEVITDTGKLTVYAAPNPVLAAGETADTVKSNVRLPSADAAGRPIRWTSSDNSLLDATTGAVHRPAYSAGDSAVTLEAAVDANQTTYNIQYNLTIATADMLDEEAVARDIALLSIDYAAGDDETHVRNGLTLSATGTNGSVITWTSSRTELIDPADGSVSRPSYEAGDQMVTLMATVTKGMESDSRSFQLLVLRGDDNTVGQVSGVTLDKPVLSLLLGGTRVALTATVYPNHAANKSVTWQSSDSTVATVDNNGLVTPVAEGTATITVTTADGSKTATSIVTMTHLVAPTGLTAGTGNGSVTLNWLPVPESVSYSVYKSTASGTYGSFPEVTVSGSTYGYTVTGLTNGTTYYFVVNAQYAEGTSGNSNEVVATPSTPSNGNGSSISTTLSSGDSGVTILINGKAENLGTIMTGKRNGQSVTTIVLDPNKLKEKLLTERNGTVIMIPFNVQSDIAVSKLNGQLVKDMENKQAVLKIQTERATYTLAAQQINIDSIFRQIGQSVALQDIKIEIEIAVPTAEMMKAVENAAAKGLFTLVAPPMEFIIKASYQETPIELSLFNTYVERIIVIPGGVELNKITTAVVVEADGTVRHVPTKVVLLDGKYYAQINSMTNSVYAVIWHHLEFRDVTNHWAKSIVNDMGSRMIIEGRAGTVFGKDDDITRAEFAAILVRGLGLKSEIGTAPFPDVKDADWFNNVIHTASGYRLINGFKDGTFRPEDRITREQAMVMIAKAMEITKGKSQTPNTKIRLQAYADASDVSVWARASIVDCLKAGIVSGRSSTELAPKAFMTRVEVTAIVQRLLQKSNLI